MDQSKKFSHNIGKNTDMHLMSCDIERTFLEYKLIFLKDTNLLLKVKKNYNYILWQIKINDK